MNKEIREQLLNTDKEREESHASRVEREKQDVSPRGNTKEDFLEFIEQLENSKQIKKELKKIMRHKV